MPKYRKKPIIIDAEIYKPGMEDGFYIHPDCYESFGQDLERCIRQSRDGCNGCQWCVPIINTLEGPHIIIPGDYIIKGIKGEKYPCKPDIFEQTYDLVEE